MSALLEELTSGFRDPVHGAQRAFRTVLTAMSHPGTIVSLPDLARDGIEPPRARGGDAPLTNLATTATLLALLDAETTIALAGRYADAAAVAYLRFHTGVRVVPEARGAAFVLIAGRDVDESRWSTWTLGSDEAPQAGATIVVEVDDLDTRGPSATALMLAGPGIATSARLVVTGIAPSFWAWRTALEAALPRGIDLVLTAGDRLAAIPRSTRVAFDQAARPEAACT